MKPGACHLDGCDIGHVLDNARDLIRGALAARKADGSGHGHRER